MFPCISLNKIWIFKHKLQQYEQRTFAATVSLRSLHAILPSFSEVLQVSSLNPVPFYPPIDLFDKHNSSCLVYTKDSQVYSSTPS